MRLAVEIDGQDLEDEERAELARLVEAAEQAGQAVESEPAPDEFQYEIEIELAGRRITISAGEMGLSEAQHRLVRWLEQRARRARGKGR